MLHAGDATCRRAPVLLPPRSSRSARPELAVLRELQQGERVARVAGRSLPVALDSAACASAPRGHAPAAPDRRAPGHELAPAPPGRASRRGVARVAARPARVLLARSLPRARPRTARGRELDVAEPRATSASTSSGGACSTRRDAAREVLLVDARASARACAEAAEREHGHRPPAARCTRRSSRASTARAETGLRRAGLPSASGRPQRGRRRERDSAVPSSRAAETASQDSRIDAPSPPVPRERELSVEALRERVHLRLVIADDCAAARGRPVYSFCRTFPLGDRVASTHPFVGRATPALARALDEALVAHGQPLAVGPERGRSRHLDRLRLEALEQLQHWSVFLLEQASRDPDRVVGRDSYEVLVERSVVDRAQTEAVVDRAARLVLSRSPTMCAASSSLTSLSRQMAHWLR